MKNKRSIKWILLGVKIWISGLMKKGKISKKNCWNNVLEVALELRQGWKIMKNILKKVSTISKMVHNSVVWLKFSLFHLTLKHSNLKLFESAETKKQSQMIRLSFYFWNARKDIKKKSFSTIFKSISHKLKKLILLLLQNCWKHEKNSLSSDFTFLFSSVCEKLL